MYNSKDLEDMSNKVLEGKLNIRTATDKEIMEWSNYNEENLLFDVDLFSLVATLSYNGIEDSHILKVVNNHYDNSFEFLKDKESGIYYLLFEN